jgi:hypothetical protein
MGHGSRRKGDCVAERGNRDEYQVRAESGFAKAESYPVDRDEIASLRYFDGAVRNGNGVLQVRAPRDC